VASTGQAHRVVALLESLTGPAPSVGFVHGMINRRAGLLDGVHQRIRTLLTLVYAVSCDETPLRVGLRKPAAGKKKAERYLLVACTEPYTTTSPSSPRCSDRSPSARHSSNATITAGS